MSQKEVINSNNINIDHILKIYKQPILDSEMEEKRFNDCLLLCDTTKITEEFYKQVSPQESNEVLIVLTSLATDFEQVEGYLDRVNDKYLGCPFMGYSPEEFKRTILDKMADLAVTSKQTQKTQNLSNEMSYSGIISSFKMENFNGGSEKKRTNVSDISYSFLLNTSFDEARDIYWSVLPKYRYHVLAVLISLATKFDQQYELLNLVNANSYFKESILDRMANLANNYQQAGTTRMNSIFGSYADKISFLKQKKFCTSPAERWHI